MSPHYTESQFKIAFIHCGLLILKSSVIIPFYSFFFDSFLLYYLLRFVFLVDFFFNVGNPLAPVTYDLPVFCKHI